MQNPTPETGTKNTSSLYGLIWAAALIIMGVMMFVQIPTKMAELEKSSYSSVVLYFARFCLYLIGVLLIGGGGKKMYAWLLIFRESRNGESREES